MTDNIKRAGSAGSCGPGDAEKPDFGLLFRSLFENMDKGAAVHRVVRGSDGKPTDYLCVDINPRCLEMLGVKREDAVGYPASIVYGMGTAPYLEEFGAADASGHPFWFDTYFARTDRHFDISVIPLGHNYFATLFNDVSERRRQEESIRRNESSLRALLENMPNQAWLKDTESHLLAANSRYAVNCGRQTVEELLGKTDLELWPQELAEKYMADDARVVAGGKSIHVEEMIDIVGKRLWFETFKTPVFDQDGKPIGTAGMALEITERKRTEEELRRHREHLEELVAERTAELRANEESLQLILDSLPDAVFIHEPDGTVVTVNRRMAEMYDLAEPATAIGEDVLHFSARDVEASMIQDYLARAMRGEDVHFEWRACSPSAMRLFDVEVYLRRIVYRGVPRILASVHDITDRKKTAAALNQHVRELAVMNKVMTGREMRIIELKQEVNALCRELERPPAHPPVWEEGGQS